MPQWLKTAIIEDRLSLCNWGAQGDGMDALQSAFGTACTGVDADKAVAFEAGSSSPGTTAELDTAARENRWDVVLSYDVLGSSVDPWGDVAKLTEIAKDALVVCFPYKDPETASQSETFLRDTDIPAIVGEFSLIHAKSRRVGSASGAMWPDRQVLLVYGSQSFIERRRLNLSDIVFEDCKAEEKLGRLIACNEELEAEKTRLVAERDQANRRSEEMQHQIHDLLNSRSWKISAPLRAAGFAARRGRAVMRHRFGSKPNADNQPLTLDGFLRSHSRLLLVNAAPSFDPERDDVALALVGAAADAGYGVVLIGWQHRETDALPGRFTLMRPNVFQIGRFDMKELVSVLRHVKPASATLLVTVPSLQIVQSLVWLEAAGVRVVYHRLYEWAQINKRGHAPWFEERLEKHLILNADKVTAVGSEASPLNPALPVSVPQSASWALQLEKILQ
jgi:hypothetical protein